MQQIFVNLVIFEFSRVDAIRTAQEERISTANWANPLDEELIKTKGLLRAPSERSNIKRSSRELKDDLILSDEQILSGQTETIDFKLCDEQTTPKLIDNTMEMLGLECSPADDSVTVFDELKILHTDNATQQTRDEDNPVQAQDSTETVISVEETVDTIQIAEPDDQTTSILNLPGDLIDSDIGDIVVDETDLNTDTGILDTAGIVVHGDVSHNLLLSKSSQLNHSELCSGDKTGETTVDHKVEESVTLTLEKCNINNLCCAGTEKNQSMDSGIDEISAEKTELKKNCDKTKVVDRVGSMSPKTTKSSLGRKKNKRRT